MNLDSEFTKRNRRLAITSALLTLAIIGAIVLLTQQPSQQPELECYEGKTQTMKIQEVADLLNTPLVELTWFPANLEVVPRITTHAYYSANYAQFSECIVSVDYLAANGLLQRNLVSIRFDSLGYIEPTKSATRCSWHFAPSGPIGTDCSIDVDAIKSTLRIRIDVSPEIEPEVALQILDGIRVVEPTK